MLFINNKQSTGETYNTLFKQYKTVINEHLEVFRKEDVNGWDCGHLQITLWYGSFLYVTMLQNAQKQGLQPLSELKRIYLYEQLKNCLHCRKIPLAEMLKLIDIDLDSTELTYGINTMIVEVTNEVENISSNNPVNVLNINNYEGTPESIAAFNSLWESESFCEIYLNSNC